MLPFPQLVQYGNTILPRSIVKIQATTESLFVLFASGNLYAIGHNTYKQFGVGTVNAVYKTWQLCNTNVADFYAGSESCLVKLNSGVWQYAGNQRLSGTTDSDPVYVNTWTNLTAMNYFANNNLTIKKIHIAGTAIGVLCTNNTLYQMGYNSQGNIGAGGTVSQPSFIVSRTNTKDFCLGIVFSLAIDLSSGILHRAGWNQYGQIGYGTNAASTTWISSGVVVNNIFTGRYTSSYISTSGTVFSTGDDAYGAIGNGHTTSTSAVVNAYTSINNGLPGAITDTTINSTKAWNTWFRTGTGIYVTGRNDSGQLSIGSTNNVGSYTKMTLPSGVQVSDIESLEITGYCSFILKNDGRTMYVSGNSNYFPDYTTTQTTFVPLSLPE